MEKRLGLISILITEKSCIDRVNGILSIYADMIMGRQGIPFHDRGIFLISIAIEGHTDRISALTGKLGRLQGVEAKSVLTKLSVKH